MDVDMAEKWQYELIDLTEPQSLLNGLPMKVVGPFEVQRLFDDRGEQGWDYAGTVPGPGDKSLLAFKRRAGV